MTFAGVAAAFASVPVPWMSDKESSLCLLCGYSFSFFQRRHHCRFCGGLFCDACSKNRAKGISGYDPNVEVRVCDICYYNDLAYLVVWNEMFTGYYIRIFSDRTEATTTFEKIPKYASRVLMKMGTGEIIASYFARQSWEQKILAQAQCQQRKHLRNRVALRGQRTPQLSVPVLPQLIVPVLPRPAPQSVVAVPPVAVPPIAVPLQAATQAQQRPPQSKPAISPRDCSEGIIVLWKTQNGDTTEHKWLYESSLAREELIHAAKTLLASLPNVMHGCILSKEGEVFHVVNNSWIAPRRAVEQGSVAYVKKLPIVSVLLRDGEYTAKPFSTLHEALASNELQNLAEDSSLMLMDHFGYVVWTRNCGKRPWLEAMAKAAGERVARHLEFEAIFVCRPDRAPTPHASLFTAQKEMWSDNSAAIFVGNKSSSIPALYAKNPSCSKELALSMSSAAKAALESASSPRSQTQAQPTGPSSQMSESLECQICFSQFNPSNHKPCICASCGNTMCFTCIKGVGNCPFCRNSLGTSGAFITNVQLLQVVEQQN